MTPLVSRTPLLMASQNANEYIRLYIRSRNVDSILDIKKAKSQTLSLHMRARVQVRNQFRFIVLKMIILCAAMQKTSEKTYIDIFFGTGRGCGCHNSRTYLSAVL